MTKCNGTDLTSLNDNLLEINCACIWNALVEDSTKVHAY